MASAAVGVVGTESWGLARVLGAVLILHSNRSRLGLEYTVRQLSRALRVKPRLPFESEWEADQAEWGRAS
jgi:hypothetical protein